MKIEDILTLIQAVSDSELTEFKITFDEEGEDGKTGRVSFTASKNAKGVVMSPQVAMPSQMTMPSQMALPPQMTMAPQVAMAPQVPLTPQAFDAQSAAAKPEGEYITSPMVGTFYSSPNEGAEPFISVGDTVKKGQVIGIVEAMKLMNEIESPYDGVVEKILVENKAMVGFGDELVLVRTK